ncbi:MAG: GNAT family N-acetyltransferase [Anaerolineae bacterium]|nr:GNAT family N-acetyltransferase [Anaerolineae bacterium]
MEIQSFESQYLEQIVTVWNHCLPVDLIAPDVLAARVLLDPNYRDDFFLLAWEGETIIGFVLGICGEGFFSPPQLAGTRAWILAMAVEAGYRQRGVGTALLAELERRFQGAGKHDIWIATYPTAYIVPGVDAVAYALGLHFFQSRGYQEMTRALAMDVSLWPPHFPEAIAVQEQQLVEQGITFQPYSQPWLSALRRFLRSALPWDWEWLALRNLSRIHDGAFSPAQFWLALYEGEVVGYCQYEGAHFGPFGVAEGFQQKGIGTVLLAHALQSMVQQGAHSAWVLWTGGAAARLYARFGFVESRQFVILKKEG